MSKKIKNSGVGWSAGDPNAWKQLEIETSLANYKETNDPICLARIVQCLDFQGFDEAQKILVEYLSEETRRTTKYTDALLWKNICDRYFRLREMPRWEDASHDALSSYLFDKYGNATQSKSDIAFAASLAGYVKKYR